MLSKSFSNLDADLKEASLLLSFRWINFHWLGGFWRHRNIQSSFGGFVLLPGFFNNHPMAGFMASLFWWRNQVHPDANTSREGKTVLSSCSCLGQGWDSPWLILGWREWEWKDRHKISIKQSGLLWFFFFPWLSWEIWALLQRADSTSLSWSSLLERDKLNPTTLSPFWFPNLLKKLPLFPLEDPISSLALLLCSNPPIKA